MGISQEERVQVVALMVAGERWQTASETVGIGISQASAYRWLQVWRVSGRDQTDQKMPRSDGAASFAYVELIYIH